MILHRWQRSDGGRVVTDGQLRINIHREINRRMPRETLSRFRIDAGFDHVGDERMPEGVEVGVAALVVDVRDSGDFQVPLKCFTGLLRPSPRSGPDRRSGFL